MISNLVMRYYLSIDVLAVFRHQSTTIRTIQFHRYHIAINAHPNEESYSASGLTLTQPPLTQSKVQNLSDASHVNDVVMTNQQTSVPDTIHNASDQEQEVERPIAQGQEILK